MKNKTECWILIVLCIAVMCFHLLILIGVIPFAITWGGRLKSTGEMYVFEFISIAINSFYLYVLLQKANMVRRFFSSKTLSVILWIFFVLFSFNTLGNLFATSRFEKTFAFLTLLNAVLIVRINHKNGETSA